MSRSIHDKLGRVRPPRVHITYEVHTDGAMLLKELPFVVGVMGDFSAHPQKRAKEGPNAGQIEQVTLEPMKDRKFIQIDRDNFDQVMQRLTPGLNFRVENTLVGDGSEFAVNLAFESLDDFEPARVAEQIEPLRQLLATRTKLRDLRNRVDLYDKLEPLLEEILKDQDKLKQLQSDLPTPTDK